MSTRVSSQAGAARSSRTESLQLASSVRARRELLLNMTIEEAAEFSGLKPEQWSELESGWIPPLDNTLWIWWTLAGTLRVSVDSLFNLAHSDLARKEIVAKERAA